MVDAIGSLGAVRLTPVTPVQATPAVTPVKAPAAPAADISMAGDGATSLALLAKSMASAAPVDKDRVAQIKRAIATGTFPILPATVADRLMALRLEWTGDDQA